MSPKHVFLVGAPRSGTTWLQLLIWQHPEVSSAQETHVFNVFLEPLDRLWKQFPKNARGVGPNAVMGDDDFREFVLKFASSVLDGIGDTEVILEKTPAHVRSAAFILDLFPDAYFLHLIRDPRAVTSSLIAASKGWGKGWASPRASLNARLWVADVARGREIRRLTPRYLELRYEDLLADSHGNLSRVFEWLDLPVDSDFCRRAVEQCGLGQLREGQATAPWALSGEPTDFYRQGRPDSWQDELTRRDVAIVESIAGDLMSDLGYSPIGNGSQPLALMMERGRGRAASGLLRLARRVAPWHDHFTNRG